MFLTMVCRKCVFHQSPAHTYPKQLYGFTKLHSRQCCPSSWPFPFLLSFVVAVSFIYLCLAALGLCFCPRALSSWREQGLLPSSSVQASHCSGVPSCGAQAPGLHSLQCEDFVAPQHVESSRSGIEPGSPALAGGFLATGPTREVPYCRFLKR